MTEILLKCLLVLCLAITISFAFPSPTDPYGSSVWTKGQKVTIKWSENEDKPLTSNFTGITIQLMTGPDLQQIPLVTIVDKLSKSATSYSYTVPSPKTLGYPSGKIYFLMFSDSKNPSFGYSWTTRFTILESSSATTTGYDPGDPWTITGGSTPTKSSTSETPNVMKTTDEPTYTQPSIPSANTTPDNPFSSSNRLNAIGGWSILIVMISMVFLI
ncbi:10840_t:CDS:2 [Diversispora eburnea]|uniref:10840_t:CDS:1 n=1 Tax=Diversispora eburnea TaxID=1213867 RepID=A0A9N8WMC2_9GLOM|nr:10840_t:CDS:2 [Diversispora eburnea]